MDDGKDFDPVAAALAMADMLDDEEEPTIQEQIKESAEKIARLSTRYERFFMGAESYDDVYEAEQTWEKLAKERANLDRLVNSLPAFAPEWGDA
jgi:hypothetical protein